MDCVTSQMPRRIFNSLGPCDETMFMCRFTENAIITDGKSFRRKKGVRQSADVDVIGVVE